MIRERRIQKKRGRGIGKDIIIIHVVYIHTEGRREGGREQNMQHTHQHAHPSHLHNCEDVYVNAHICSIKHTHTHTHTHTREAHDTHCSRAFCGTSGRLVSVPTLQLLQVVQTRLERGGGGGGV